MVKKFFIIAGEASGDLLGMKLVKEMKKRFGEENLVFVGVGGDLMKKEGLRSIFDMNELSVMGFVEIVPHIFHFLKRIKQTAREIKKENPDYIITIDSPDFNFRVMKKLEKYKNVKKIHLIAPSVWAYREKRAKKIAKLYDLLLTILPFEPPYFEKYGLKSKFVGHPILSNVPDFSKKTQIRKDFRNQNGFYENDKIIYVTPGSRISEVKKIFPEFILAINELKNKVENLSVIIPVVDKSEDLVSQMAKDLEVKYILVKQNEKEKAMMSCDFALAKSGTNTLEISLFELPMIVCYKVNSLTHFIARILIKIKYANLINILKDKMVIKELIQDDCNQENITNSLIELIENKEKCQLQIKESISALRQMGLGFEKDSSEIAIDEILKL